MQISLREESNRARVQGGRIGCLLIFVAVVGCSTTTSKHTGATIPAPRAAEAAKPTTDAGSLVSGNHKPTEAPRSEPSVPAGQPEQHRPISLAEAIQIALNDNLDVALARAQEEVSKARAAASTHALVPSIDLGTGVSHTEGLVQGSFGDFQNIESRSVTAGVGISLRANIGARIYETMAARREVAAALKDTMATRQKLVLSVIELYQNLALAKAGIAIAGQLVESSAEFERIASARLEGGIGLGSDVARVQANHAKSQQQLVQAENLLKNASVRLAVVLRLDPAVILEPTNTSLEPWQVPPGAEADAYADLARGRPDVEAQRERVEASKRLAQARWWDLVAPEVVLEWRLTGVGGDRVGEGASRGPSLSTAAGSVGRSVSLWQNATNAPTTPGTNPLPALSNAAGSGGRAYYAYKNLLEDPHQDLDSLHRQERYGVWLNWNLSFAKADRIREQRALAKAAGLRATKSEEAAVGEIWQAQHDIGSTLQLAALAHNEIEAAETNHRLSLARFTAGTAIAFEVLDAQDTLAEARLKLVRYITELNIAQARFLTTAGVIEEHYPQWTQPAPSP